MSDKEILIDDDDSFKELQVKWRNNSLTDEEKDLYIKHLTLRHIDKKKSSRELQAENERLKSEIARKVKIIAMQSETEDALERENERLKSELDACSEACTTLYADKQKLSSLVSHISTEHEACQLKLAQYESTPERGLKTIATKHNINFRASNHEYVGIFIGDDLLVERETSIDHWQLPPITAEDIG